MGSYLDAMAAMDHETMCGGTPDNRPTQEELDDAIIEDTRHCDLCGVSFVLGGCPDYVIVDSPAPESTVTTLAQLKLCGHCAGLVSQADKENLIAAGICEHGIADGEYCEPCNAEYKRARRANGLDGDGPI